jgi:hypothetical protein
MSSSCSQLLGVARIQYNAQETIDKTALAADLQEEQETFENEQDTAMSIQADNALHAQVGDMMPVDMDYSEMQESEVARNVYKARNEVIVTGTAKEYDRFVTISFDTEQKLNNANLLKAVQ